MDGRTDGWTDGRMDGHRTIHPCVLQDIGPLGPLPKKDAKVVWVLLKNQSFIQSIII